MVILKLSYITNWYTWIPCHYLLLGRKRQLHCNDATQASRRFKSQTTRLLIQQFIQASSKDNIKAQYYWPFVMQIHRWWIDFPHKGAVIRKAFHCNDVIIPNISMTTLLEDSCVVEVVTHDIDWDVDGVVIMVMDVDDLCQVKRYPLVIIYWC